MLPNAGAAGELVAGRGGRGPLGGAAGAAGLGSGGVAGTSAGAGAGSGSACPAKATAKPGETTKSLMVGGQTRSYLLHVPPGYDGKKALPVIFDFHALGGTGSSQKMLSGWSSLADKEGIIMVWPDGVGNSWNVGRCCSTAQSQNVDDVGFARAILAQLEQDACVDPRRVYATGCSNGGGMAFKMACDAADVIAAVAPVDFDCVTGSSPEPSCAECAPARPISEIQFRGTSDTAVPYGGGSGPRGTVFPGAEENFSEWKAIDQCTGSPSSVPGHPSCEAYTTCGADAETVLCTVQNGMHCGNYGAFGIIDIAWESFQRHALP